MAEGARGTMIVIVVIVVVVIIIVKIFMIQGLLSRTSETRLSIFSIAAHSEQNIARIARSVGMCSVKQHD